MVQVFAPVGAIENELPEQMASLFAEIVDNINFLTFKKKNKRCDIS